jgi:hypothetical protein
MQGRFLGNSGELNPEIWDAANVRFCLKAWIYPRALATPSLRVNLPRLRLPSLAYLVAVKRFAFQWCCCRNGPDPVSEAEWV